MRFLRVLAAARFPMALGLLTLTLGCDGSGGDGESSVTPLTPPPGKSEKEQAELRKNSFPVGPGAAKKFGDASRKN